MAVEQPKIKLYWLEKSRAQSILWLLEELKLEYELEVFHRNEETMRAPAELKKVHALGKSPVLTITPAGPDAEPIVLAETGFIIQYLCDHFAAGTTMVPPRYRPGREGQPGGETEAWLRWQYFLHYTEGTLMATLVAALVLGNLRGPKMPFYVRPVTSLVASGVFAAWIFPNVRTNLAFLEERLATSGGGYLCGPSMTAADIMLSFGLIQAKDQFETFGAWDRPPHEKFPKVWAFIERMESQPGYKRSMEKITEIDDTLGFKF